MDTTRQRIETRGYEDNPVERYRDGDRDEDRSWIGICSDRRSDGDGKCDGDDEMLVMQEHDGMWMAMVH